MSRFAPEMESIGVLKCWRFEGRLQPSIQQHVVVNTFTKYGKLVNVSLRMEKQKDDARNITERSSLMRTREASGTG